MDLDYIRKINGTYGKTCRQSFIDEMLCQYETANKNVITEFDVLINSSKALEVFIDGEPARVLMEYKNNKNTNDANFMWEVRNYPNVMKTGSCILHHNEITDIDDYYLCTSKPMNKRGYDVNYVQHCNQKINISKEIFIPCIAEGESYGVKIFSSSGELMSDIDTKIKVTVKRDNISEIIPLNTRFILGQSKDGVYVIGDKSMYNNGLITYTCKKDKWMEGLDDSENWVAYNGDLDIPSDDNDNTKPTEYIITGEDSIRKGQSETYKINYAHENGGWSVEDYSGSVEIVNQDNSSITLKCLTYGDYITLSYKVNDAVVVSKDIELLR